MDNPIPAPTVDELKLTVSSLFVLLTNVAKAVNNGDLFDAQTALRNANFAGTMAGVKSIIAEATEKPITPFKFKIGERVEYFNPVTRTMKQFTIEESVHTFEDGTVYGYRDGSMRWAYIREDVLRRVEQGINFIDAAKALDYSGKVTRSVWMDGSYLVAENGHILCVCDGKRSPANFVVADIKANDWKVL